MRVLHGGNGAARLLPPIVIWVTTPDSGQRQYKPAAPFIVTPKGQGGRLAQAMRANPWCAFTTRPRFIQPASPSRECQHDQAWSPPGPCRPAVYTDMTLPTQNPHDTCHPGGQPSAWPHRPTRKQISAGPVAIQEKDNCPTPKGVLHRF